MIPTPKLGTIVTFSYQSYSRREVPVGPKIYRIRTDVTWPEIVANDTKDKVYLNGLLFIVNIFLLFFLLFIFIYFFQQKLTFSSLPICRTLQCKRVHVTATKTLDPQKNAFIFRKIC